MRAAAVLAVSVIGIGTGYQLLGNESDAIAVGQIDIAPAPLPAASDNLEGNGTDLPDLLDGIVAPGANPTEQLDALGNPIGAAEAALAGGEQPAAQPVETIANVQPVSTGPRTIMIDGQPIDGGSVTTAALPKAPFSDIVRNSPFGQVPTISNTGKKALDSYARPFTPTAGKSQVAIIIGGLGIDRNLTRRIIAETPPEVTLSFAAHTNGLQTWVHQARDRGHEVMIELPMEGNNFNAAEPGAGRALKAEASTAVNIRNLDWLLSRAQGYFAITNYNGDRLISSDAAITPILQHLSNAGVGFVYDGSLSSDNLQGQSASANLTYKRAYNIIDNSSDFSAINAELSRLEAAASASPQIGVGFALPETVLALKSWMSSLDAKGLELAPASFVIKR